MRVSLRRFGHAHAVPSYAGPGDAGADLFAAAAVTLEASGGRALVPTGVAVALPEGTAGLIVPRSGLALRHGVSLANAPGLIDAGFRGELQVVLVNHDPLEDYEVHVGDRIAQLVVVEVASVQFVEVEELPDSERGEGGFGHSGR